jgi:RNase P/RNase MRP subunit POP5
MKTLKPSHREKKRYLLIKGKDADKKNIEETILEFVGILGLAEASLQVVKTTNSGIIVAVNRGSLDKIRSSFLLSEKDLQIIKVSGTVKKLK